MTGSEHHTHTQHTTHNSQHTTHKNMMSRCRPTPSGVALYVHGNICMAPNHGAVAPHESVAGAWQWVCSCRGWFPWLGCQINMHQKIERGAGPWL